MKKLVCLLGIVLLAHYVALAQEGSYTGELRVAHMKLGFVMHLYNENGVWVTKMDSPDQGAFGIPMANTNLLGDSIFIAHPDIKMEYKAKVYSDSLVGQFVQMGNAIPLVLYKNTKSEKLPVKALVQTPKAPFDYLIDTLSITHIDGVQIRGVLTRPKNYSKYPLAILISGSGSQDFNSTIMGHQPFWVLADSLTKAGIAVFRFDDRGVGGSTGNPAFTTSDTIAKDVVAIIQYLKKYDTKFAQVIPVGHSLGGTVAIKLAAQHPKLLDATVLLATPGLKGSDIVIQQYKDLNAGKMSEEVIAQNIQHTKHLQQLVFDAKDSIDLATLLMREAERQYGLLPETHRKNKNVNDIFEQLNNAMNNVLYKDIITYNPAADIQRITSPILILNGGKDIQVNAAENTKAIYTNLKNKVAKKSTVKIYPQLNHLFQSAKTGLPEEYGDLEETFNTQVIGDIIQFIQKL